MGDILVRVYFHAQVLAIYFDWYFAITIVLKPPISGIAIITVNNETTLTSLATTITSQTLPLFVWIILPEISFHVMRGVHKCIS